MGVSLASAAVLCPRYEEIVFSLSRRRSFARSTSPGFSVGSRFGLDVGSNNGDAVWTRSEVRLRRRS